MTIHASHELKNVNTEDLTFGQLGNKAGLEADMGKLLARVRTGDFDTVLDVGVELEQLETRANEIGSSLPEAYRSSIKARVDYIISQREQSKGSVGTPGVRRDVSVAEVEQTNRQGTVKTMLQKANQLIDSGNEANYWQFSKSVHQYCTAHGFNSERIDLLDTVAADTFEADVEVVILPDIKLADPFEGYTPAKPRTRRVQTVNPFVGQPETKLAKKKIKTANPFEGYTPAKPKARRAQTVNPFEGQGGSKVVTKQVKTANPFT